MKNYAILLVFVAFLSCKKDSGQEALHTKPIATSELLTQQWKKQTAQVLEDGYDHSVKTDQNFAIWNFKKGGEFLLKECAECPVISNSANWTLSADNKKIFVTLSPTRKMEYSIISITAEKLVVRAVDIVGICGPFDTTGKPGWVAPACPKGLVQYEFVAIKN